MVLSIELPNTSRKSNKYASSSPCATILSEVSFGLIFETIGKPDKNFDPALFVLLPQYSKLYINDGAILLHLCAVKIAGKLNKASVVASVI